jgi:PIN domain nuclease of toxin-antitoxin system
MTATLALPGVRLAPLEAAIAVASVSLPGNLHPDPADRIIVATARHHGWPLVSADSAILDYARAGHVQALDAAR